MSEIRDIIKEGMADGAPDPTEEEIVRFVSEGVAARLEGMLWPERAMEVKRLRAVLEAELEALNG